MPRNIVPVSRSYRHRILFDVTSDVRIICKGWSCSSCEENRRFILLYLCFIMAVSAIKDLIAAGSSDFTFPLVMRATNPRKTPQKGFSNQSNLHFPNRNTSWSAKLNPYRKSRKWPNLPRTPRSKTHRHYGLVTSPRWQINPHGLWHLGYETAPHYGWNPIFFLLNWKITQIGPFIVTNLLQELRAH